MTAIKFVKKNSSQAVKKHVSIIHCSNNLSLLQRKISNVLLFHAYPFLETQEEHKISIRSLCSYLEYHGCNYDVIKHALKALISTIIEWNVVDDNLGEDWTASSILASVNIKGAVCSYSYSPRMKQLLYSPAMYGKIDLLVQSKFTSGYALALYENCVRYRNLNRTKVFSLEMFRKIMGVSSGKYLIFRDFKKRVINKAVEEINKLSDLIIQPNINKVGQQVTSIYFEISEKKKSTTSNETFVEDRLVVSIGRINIKEKLMSSYCFNEESVEKIIEKYGIEKIEEKLKQIESTTSFTAGNIANLAGFLIDALKKDYVLSKDRKILMEERRMKKDLEWNETNRKEKQQNIEMKKYENYIDSQVKQFVCSLDFESLSKLKMQFEEFLLKENAKFVLNTFSKRGFTSKIVRVFLKNFLKVPNSNYKMEFITFEQFICVDNEKIPVTGK